MKKSILFLGVLLLGFSTFNSVNGQERIKTSYVNSVLPEQSFQSSSSSEFESAFYEQESVAEASELFPSTDTTYTFSDSELPDNFAAYTGGTISGRSVSSNAWFVTQSVNTFENSYSLKTGDISALEATNNGFWVRIDKGGGTLQFKYRVSTEPNDFFFIDAKGTSLDTLSGDIPWTDSPVYDLPAGDYYIDFWYLKDDSLDDPNGIDAAFLDNIQITGLKTEPLMISSVEPYAVAPLSNVTIHGSGFSDVNSYVYFGNNQASFQYISDSKIIAEVPSSVSSGFQNITLLNSYGSDDEIAVYSNFSVLKPTEINYQLHSTNIPQLNYGASDFADVEGDGDLDLFMLGSSEFSGTVANLYLNDGNGNFTNSSNSFQSDAGRTSVTFGDVNSDGAPDLLIAGSYLYINDGSGNFSISSQSFDELNYSSSVFADVDRDGDQDVFITGRNSLNQPSSELYLNDGSGNFTVSGQVFTDVDYGDAAFNDVENDGDLDLAVVGRNTSTIYLNDGNGGFDSGSSAGLTGSSSASIAFADANDDGYSDVLITGNGGRITTLYLNDEDGTFTASGNSFTGVTNGDGEFGDVDGDGDQDILITGLDAGSARRTLLYENDGSGDYSSVSTSLEAAAESSVDFADTDGDGDLDILVHGRGDSGFVGNIYKNEGAEIETFITKVIPEAATAGATVSIFGEGFNSSTQILIDGESAFIESFNSTKVTVTVPSISPGNTQLLAHTDGDVATYSGLFTVIKEQPSYFEFSKTIDNGNTYSNHSISLDLDGDEDYDIVESYYNAGISSHEIYPLINDGAGNFTYGNAISKTYMNTRASGDFNNDGHDDIVFHTTSGLDSLIFLPSNGDGTFGTKVEITRTLTDSYFDMEAADINNDGFLDIAVASYSSGYLTWFPGNGDGTFGSETFIENSGDIPNISDAYFDDLDNDGDLDLITTQRGSINEVKWYRNNGAGAFSYLGVIGSNFSYYKIATTDLNDDSYQDIIVGHSNGIYYLLNNSGSSFSSQISLTSGNEVSAINHLKVVDLDGDGDEDIVADNNSYLFWVEKTGTSSYSNKRVILREGLTIALHTRDFDGDGDIDIIGNDNSDVIEYFENIIPDPNIVSISPKAAAPGATVEVLGKGFSKNLSELSVSVDGVEAVLTESLGESSYGTILKFEIPEVAFGSADITINSGDKSVTLENKFTVLKNEGANFTSQEEVYSNPEQPYITKFGDLNGDGYKDIVSWSNTNDNLDWFQNNQSGGFNSRSPIASNVNTPDIEIVDIDLDGDLDIVTIDRNTDAIRVFPNLGTGSFSSPYNLFEPNSDSGVNFYTLEMEDIDGDGYPDPIIHYTYTTGCSFGCTTYYAISWIKNIDGFTAENVYQIQASTSSSLLSGFKVADYDNNGTQDVLMLRNNSDIYFYSNDGYGDFSYEGIYYNGPTNDGISQDGFDVADFDGDGFKDFIISRSYMNGLFNNNISIGLGDGGSSATTLTPLDESAGKASFVRLFDFDGDGNQDILAGYNATDEIKIFTTNGSTVADTISVATSSTIDTPRFLDAGDVDNDGDLDVVSASSSDNLIAWYENEAPPLPLTSIADARELEEDETVRIQGIITRKYENVHKIQQDNAGLHIWATEDFNALLFNANIQIGDSVEIIGTLSEVTSLKELTSITEVNVLSSENVLPDPMEIVLNDITDFEQYESVLVHVSDLKTDSTGLTFRKNTSYDLYEGGNAITIPIAIAAENTTELIDESIPANFEYTGIIYQNSENGTGGYQLYPINSDDINATAGNEILSIAEVKQLEDGSLINIEGIAITPPLESGSRTSFFIQDEGQGINVFKFGTPSKSINIGDSIRVTGEIDTFNGLREVVVDNIDNDITIINTGNVVPEPRNISFEEFKSAGNPTTDVQNLQGTLVRINGLITDPATWPQNASSASVNVSVTDFKDSTYTVRLFAQTEAIGVTPPSYFDLIGVLGTFNQSQISPRFESDIIEIATPGPLNLTAEATSSSIDLAWRPSPAANIGGYNIYRSTSTFTDSTSVTKLNTGIVGDTTFTDSNPQENETYFYRVSAVDSTSFNSTQLSNEVYVGFKLKRAYALSKTAGDVGSDITIFGTNLPTSTGAYSISVGGSTSSITAATARTVTFTIPDVTPGTYPVVVTIDGNTTLQTPDYLTVLNDTPEESGYFQSATEIQALTGIIDIKNADLDGDEDLDILATSYNESTAGNVEYLENEDNLTFSNPLNIGAEGDSRARNSVYGDFDGDGDIDIASIYNQSLAWYENDGTGMFSSNLNSVIDQFNSRESYQTQELIAFDADLDGDTDLIHAEKIADNVNYYQNDGTGSFSLQQTIDSNAPLISSLTYADIDGDGDMDVLATLQASNQLVRYVNNGGVFSARSEITNSVSSPQKVITGDLDNDGDQDALSISTGDSKVAWYSNNAGTGSYSTQKIISEDLTNPFTAALADLNGDDLVDVIVATLSGDLVWYENQGSENFGSAATLLSGAGELRSLAIADLNENGKLDILTGDFTNNQLLFFRNVDSPPAPPTGVTATRNIGSIILNWEPNDESDLAGYDIFRSTEIDNNFVSISGGVQTETTFTDTNLVNGVTYYYRVASVDDNGTRVQASSVAIKAISTQIAGIEPMTGIEGTRVRIFGVGFSNINTENTVNFGASSATVIDSDSSYVSVEVPSGLSGNVEVSITSKGNEYTYPATFKILTESPGTFSEASTVTGFTGIANIGTADLDGNGFGDLIVPMPDDNQIALYFSDGEDPFNSSNTLFYSSNTEPKIIRPINIFGDDYPDFVFISELNNQFVVLKNNGGSTSSSFLDPSTITASHVTPTDIIPADMNNDGFTDVVISSSGDGKISWYENQSFNSEVAFSSENNIVSSDGQIRSISVADFNDDGLKDIVAAIAGNSQIAWYRNNGNGSYTKISIVNNISEPERVLATDLDNDGDSDIVYVSSDDDLIGAAINSDGNGNFSTINIGTGISGASDVSVGDLNGDGQPDVLTISPNTGEVFWFENNGGNSFSNAITISREFSGAISIIPYDADGNGQLDVAVRTNSFGALGVLMNFRITPLEITGILTGTDNNTIRTRDSFSLEFDNSTDISSISNLSTIIEDAMTIRNSDGTTFIANNVDFGSGNTIEVSNINLFSLDTLSVQVSPQTVNDNSGGLYFLDVDGDGVQTSADDTYTSAEFYTTMIGDFNYDMGVDFDDLTLFSDGWRNNDFSFETAPLDFASSTFPQAQLDTDNDFNVDDIVSFIRFWNLTQDRNSAAKAQEFAAKRQNNSKLQNLADIQSSQMNGQTELDGYSDLENAPAPASSKKAATSSMSDSLQFISYSKAEQTAQYVNNPNSNSAREVTYNFALSHPDSVMALALTIDYDQERLSIAGIEDQELFDIHSSNATVFLSHIDSTNGIITLNIANFGQLTSIDKREIMSLTFTSLNDLDSDMIITSDIRAKGKPAMQQTAMKAVQVREDLPETFALSQNYPNPFNPTTSIHYELSEQARVNISVFDILGRKVETILDQNGIRPGYYKVQWDASRYASGMYIYVLNVQSASGKVYSMTKKMLMVK